MENNKNKNKYLSIINNIQKVRQKNNKNWMDLMKLSFSLDPQKSKKIVQEIFKSDKRINKLIKKLIK
tara:strand:- start:774 stop:974 length:201 start_codon:yes stop_codon:yes gene_type:complete